MKVIECKWSKAKYPVLSVDGVRIAQVWDCGGDGGYEWVGGAPFESYATRELAMAAVEERLGVREVVDTPGGPHA